MAAKPEPPYVDFPLYAHANGQWAKRVHGRLHYFGVWADPYAALNLWMQQKDALYGNHTVLPENVTLKELLNSYLDHCQQQVQDGELRHNTYKRYCRSCDHLATLGLTREVSSLTPEDFLRLRSKLTQNYSPPTVAGIIQEIRSALNFGQEQFLIKINTGGQFKRPALRRIREYRNTRTPRIFTREEALRLLAKSELPLRAMLYLAVNGGFGATDCGTLPRSAVDLDAGWIHYPRVKTGVARRCPLWPETLEVLQKEVKRQSNNTEYFFVDHKGRPFCGIKSPGARVSAACQELLDTLEITRDGRGFYSLRHCFQTIAERTGDFPAIAAVMGHAPRAGDMGAFYRHILGPEEEERLRKVCEEVRLWLWPPEPPPRPGPRATSGRGVKKPRKSTATR